MKFWWLTDFSRLSAEKLAIEKLAAEEGWFRLDGWRLNQYRLSADGVIIAHDIEYPVRIIFPDQYPSVPAWVEPQDVNARWSKHQYGKGGPLCLELRPDNWTQGAMGSDVLRSAYHLLRTENPLGDGPHDRVESDHRIGDVQAYNWEGEPVLISAGCLERIRSGAAEGLGAIRWWWDEEVWPILVFDGVDAAGPVVPPKFDIGSIRLEIPVIVTNGDVPVPLPRTRAELLDALGVPAESRVANGALLVIACGPSGMTPIHSSSEDSVYLRQFIPLPAAEYGKRSGRADAASGKSVAIVGLGSVGSKVAEILLRSGISRHILVDGDVFLPANLERHTLDWRDIGFRKASAVRRRLLHIAGGASVTAITSNLDWQRSAKTHADQMEAVADCDLIINATGDAPTALSLGAIAAENLKPFVSVEVFEGGLGALIARSLPGRDVSFIEGRMAYDAFCEEKGVSPPPMGQHAYEAFAVDGTPMVADDAAATMAAGHTARVVLDILDDAADIGDAAWLLVGFRKGWLFNNGHGDSIALDVGRARPAREQVDDPVGREFALALAKEARGASAVTD